MYRDAIKQQRNNVAENSIPITFSFANDKHFGDENNFKDKIHQGDALG